MSPIQDNYKVTKPKIMHYIMEHSLFQPYSRVVTKEHTTILLNYAYFPEFGIKNNKKSKKKRTLE